MNPRALLTTLALTLGLVGSLAPARATIYADAYVGGERGAEAWGSITDDVTGEETWAYAHGAEGVSASAGTNPPTADDFFHLHIQTCRPVEDPAGEFWYECTERNFEASDDALEIDPALRTASFTGTLRDEQGATCDVAASWRGGDIDHDYYAGAGTGRHFSGAIGYVNLWRTADVTFSATCLPGVTLGDAGIWAGAGGGAFVSNYED